MLTILVVQLFALASPGPDFFFVVRQSAKGSVKAGILASIGISIGIIFWAGLDIFGVAILNYGNNLLQYLMMIAGGCYLCYVGQILLRVKENASFKNLEQESKDNKHLIKNSTIRQIINGLLINIFNAKAAIYFASVASKFVADFPKFTQHLQLLALFVFSTFFYFCLISLLFSRKPVRNFYEKYSRYIDNCSGLIFIAFGGFLLFEGIKFFI